MLTPVAEKKLFLLDAFALIYRAYFAFAKNPRVNSKGQNTSAAFGFTNALIDVIQKEQPTHLAVVFDAPGGATNRTADYEHYKANRDEMPEDIRSMIEPIKRILEAFHIPVLLLEGFEADDIIGTLAKRAEEEGFITYMMTPDKDFGQLVSENIFIYKPGRGGDPASVMGVKEVCEKFEVSNPMQVIDILGLWGDAVDNIPGIPGVGEKTAKKLIQDYGSMEELFKNTDDLKGKMKENVIAFEEQGRLSKMLATIIVDVPVPFDPLDLRLDKPDTEKVKEIFTELEFRNLAKRVIGEEIVVTSSANGENGQLDLFGTQSLVEVQQASPTAGYKTIATEKPSYHHVSLPEERAELLAKLMKQTSVCFDTETTDIEAMHADLVGASFCFKEREAYYVSFPKEFDAAKKIIHEFAPFFQSKTIEKIAHNLKYDMKVLMRYDLQLDGPLFDTMVAHYLIQPEAKQGMDFLAQYYLQYQPVSIETLIGKKGKNQGNMGDLPQEQIVDYACEDADITFQLKQLFAPQIEKDHLRHLFHTIEMPLVTVLAKMENEGVAIDVDHLKNYSKQLEMETGELETSIKAEAGMDFNLDSPKQLGEVLFDHMKISSKAKKTKTGQYATSEDILQQHKSDHPIIGMILDYRQMRKLKSTYVDPLPTMLDRVDGRVHTSFMQTVTATGRLSSNNPNLQNIPIRTDRGKEIRRAFIARDTNHQLMSADYSQIELRVIAALSNDTSMIQAFKDGVDIHKATASKVFHTPLEEVTKEQRSAAKAVNFGIIYGQSAFGLSQNLGISRTEAKQIIDSYFAQYSTIKGYMDNAVKNARENGYVETIMQRRRYLPDINSANAVVRGFAERNAINAPIQGSAADIVKLAMVAVDKAMTEANVQSKMILQVHDELVFDILKGEEEVMKKLVKTAMEGAIQLAVPMEVEMELADNWLDAH
ncbi:MAG: DNA polymerase I [Candidatus Fluviicola riflensis]|nr:MAG: DNA polymerase I [Candidatus Fluviicola riflensis]OGS77733.1 MAG: DNA polymerase I [Candidatus Fluviicola riflensis]OGS84316.1 MAG: DNA polymerase I [Fluviicola sp. RIFCSPHIGHO2_12_FULL_43_24]OGS84798.1 MAG: DNA polymerase I [Fluviicola sp. RIFCSPHIGHO2_01_FULL_43_53]